MKSVLISQQRQMLYPYHLRCNFCCRFVSILLWERFHVVDHFQGKSGWHYYFQVPYLFLVPVTLTSLRQLRSRWRHSATFETKWRICMLETATYDKSCGLLQDWIGRCQNFYAWVSQSYTSAWHSSNFTLRFSVKNIVIHQKVHRCTFIQVDLWSIIFPRWRPQWLGLIYSTEKAPLWLCIATSQKHVGMYVFGLSPVCI